MKIYNARNLVTFRNIVVQVLLQVRIIIVSVENCKSFTYKFDMNRLIIPLNKNSLKVCYNSRPANSLQRNFKTRQKHLSHLGPKRNYCSHGNGEVNKIPFKVLFEKELLA